MSLGESPHALLVVEAVATFLAFGAVLLLARRIRGRTSGPGRAFRAFAARKPLAVAAVFALTFAGQILLVPVFGLPEPYVHDEFGYLLAAETFASGRLTNPPHPYWQHFETFHVLQRPTYMAMHPPGPALVLAAARAIWGEPAVGVWLATGAACAAVTWMLQAFVPPAWALVGGLLAAFRIGLFSYWSTTFWGGSVAAAAGAVLLGAVARLPRGAGSGIGLAGGLGASFLLLTRPFEGLLAAGPLGVAAAVRLFRSRPRVGPALRTTIAAAAVLACAIAFLGLYSAAVTGTAWRLPYQVQRSTYAVGQHFVWQRPLPAPAYRHEELRRFYAGWELSGFQGSRRAGDLFRLWGSKARNLWLFYVGPALTLPFLLGLFRPWRGKRVLPGVVLGASAIGWAVVAWGLSPHYAAPVFGALVLPVVDGLRRLSTLRVRSERVGHLALLGVAIPLAVTAACRLAAQPLGLRLGAWPPAWYSTVRYAGYTRNALQDDLLRRGGRHLVFVRYGPAHVPHLEWVFNGADLAAAPVLWARSMGEAADARLARFEKGRTAWLLEPDVDPYRLVPYEPREPGSPSEGPPSP